MQLSFFAYTTKLSVSSHEGASFSLSIYIRHTVCPTKEAFGIFEEQSKSSLSITGQCFRSLVLEPPAGDKRCLEQFDEYRDSNLCKCVNTQTHFSPLLCVCGGGGGLDPAWFSRWEVLLYQQ